MESRLSLMSFLLDSAYTTLRQNAEHLGLDEALFVPRGGYRSVLGTLKHAAAWSHVYHSFAFDAHPRKWSQLDWPHGVRDGVVKSQAYVDDVIAWMDAAHHNWQASLRGVTEGQLAELHALHWGESAPLFDIITRIAGHHLYHAGEINQLRSIYKGEAWEDGEEVEENNVPSAGHRVIPPWRVSS
jgi:hypothetical protein